MIDCKALPVALDALEHPGATTLPPLPTGWVLEASPGVFRHLYALVVDFSIGQVRRMYIINEAMPPHGTKRTNQKKRWKRKTIDSVLPLE